MSDEMKKLDAMANAVSAPSEGNMSEKSPPKSPLSKRRSAKQPISYAEPRINSKLRRGDVYFPKKETMTDDADIGTTEMSASGDLGTKETGGSNHADCRIRQSNTDSSNVLNDLVATPAT